MGVVAWVVEHWELLASILFGLLTVASFVTRLTDTPKDDQVVKKILGFLSFLRPKDQTESLKIKGESATKLPLTTPGERKESVVPFRRADRK